MLREALLLLLLSLALSQNQTKQPIVSPICSIQCSWGELEVNGVGNYRVRPDIATLSFQINANGETVDAAINALSVKVKALLATLSALGISDSNLKTNYLNVYPNSSYVNGTTIIYGQIAYLDMTITISVPNPATSGALIAKIYDGLSKITNINIYGITFDLKDKTAAFIQARKLAYNDAEARAKDYAGSAGVKLGAALSITDTFSYAPYYYTSVVNGFVVINYNVKVVFAFK